MKKILLFLIFICLSGVIIAQTGPGWGQQRSKVHFKDSTYYDKNAEFNSSVWIRNLSNGLTTTVTAGGTTTLLSTSDYYQTFTGTLTQSVVMPDVTTCTLSTQFYISNLGTGIITVKSSGGNTICTMAGGTEVRVNCILLTGTTAASWDFYYNATFVANSKRLYVSRTLTLTGTDGVTLTFPTTDATIARTDAGQTFTGVQTFSSIPLIGTFNAGRQHSVTATLAAGVLTDVTLTGVTTKPYNIMIQTTGGNDITSAVSDSLAFTGGVYHLHVYSVDLITNAEIKVTH